MTDPDLQDDDGLVRALARAFDAVEAGSPAAEQVARAAIDLGRLDAELADLVSDSYAVDGGELAVRAGEQTMSRVLAYAHDGIEVEIDLPAGEPRMIGAVELPDEIAVPIDVLLVWTDGTRSVDVDVFGRFEVPLPSGSVRLVVRAGGVAMSTPWITR